MIRATPAEESVALIANIAICLSNFALTARTYSLVHVSWLKNGDKKTPACVPSHDEIVHRKIFAEIPLRVEYSLTEHGRSLAPVIEAICQWGANHLRRPPDQLG